MSDTTDDKYITFKRQEFMAWLGEISTLDLRSYETPKLLEDLDSLALPDAVVIRRQDTFASPALLTYAAMISMVGKNHPDVGVGQELLAIADYFQRQGELAGDEAFKLPDL